MRYTHLPYTLESLLNRMDEYKECDDNEKRYMRELGLMWRGKPTHLGSIVHAAYESDVVDNACIDMMLCANTKNEKMTHRWVSDGLSRENWNIIGQQERVLFTLAWIECQYGINPTTNAGYSVKASDLPFYTSQQHLIHHMHTQHDQLSPLVNALDYIERISEKEVWSLYIIKPIEREGDEDERFFIADFYSEKKLRKYLSTMVKEEDLYLYEMTEWNYNKTHCFDTNLAEEWV